MNAAIENLKTNQHQLDADGCMVGVSRQALEEVLALFDWRPITTAPDDEAVILATEGGWVGQASKSYQYPHDDELHWCWAGANGPLHQTLKPVAWMPLPKFSIQPSA